LKTPENSPLLSRWVSSPECSAFCCGLCLSVERNKFSWEASVSRLLTDLEIDAACWEFLAQRIVQLGGTPPQPIVQVLDAPPDPDEDPDWDELTARAAKMMPEPGAETAIEMVDRVLGRMGA
jgi:hypothetical protein